MSIFISFLLKLAVLHKLKVSARGIIL